MNAVRQNRNSLHGDGHWARASAPTKSKAQCAEIFGVSTQPPTVEGAAGERRLVLRVSDLARLPTHQGRDIAQAGGEVRAVDGVSSPWSRAAPWASSANPVRANRRH